MGKIKIFKPFEHQKQFAEFWGNTGRVLNFDSCGTGKTLGCIYAIKENWPDARVLVVAPLSILRPAWVRDLEFGWRGVKYAVAEQTRIKKKKAFESDAQWVITNHDTIKMVAEDYANDFDIMIIDEADAFRNRTTQRSRAANYVAKQVPIVSIMTGTPNPNTVLDIWHLAFLVDGGERLGKNFFGFRQSVCKPSPIYGAPAGAMKWTDKDDADDQVGMMLADITTRVALDDVTELPDTIYRDVITQIPKKVRVQYEMLKQESVMLMETGELVNAIHAGSRVQKLLQTCAGAIYNEEHVALDVHKERHSLILDLVEETNASLVAFNWKHQRDGLEKEALKRQRAGTLGAYAIIDGSVPNAHRNVIVEQFQRGEIQVIFMQPQSAAHGLTLTAANRVIWASPTYRADLYEQFNHRVIRTGQTRKTEIINICADDTVEEDVYEVLQGKRGRMADLLSTLKELSE